MIRVSKDAWLIRANVFGEMITALGVIFLGAILYLTLRRWSESMALIGLCFHVLEAALLAASRIAALSLLWRSSRQEDAGAFLDRTESRTLAA